MRPKRLNYEINSRSTAVAFSCRASVALKRRSQIALFVLGFAIFFLSPIMEVDADPKYSMLVSESIIKHGTPAINHAAIPGLDESTLPAHPNLKIGSTFYQLGKINGKVEYLYPHGSSLLSLPFIALLNAAGLSALDAKGNYSHTGEIWLQKIVSSFLMAITSCLLFESACMLLPWSWSLGITVGAAFGTQIWSTATRALWSLTWEVFLAACLVLILLKREEQQPSRWRAPVLATLASWMYFIRPDGAITVLALSALMLFRYGDEFLIYTATGLAWLCAFLIYSWVNFVPLLPDYYRQGTALHLHGWVVGFAGCLISPSRGLFIFVPSILIVIYISAHHWNSLPAWPLALLAAGIICTKLCMVAAWPVWWGGFSYGPRLLTDLVPWFVLLAILGFRAHLDDLAKIPGDRRRSIKSRTVSAIALLLTVFSIAINGYGALSVQPQLWNWRMGVDVHPDRLWDWRSPQFLAGIRRSTRSDR